MTYARDGYAFYSVQTPQFFSECELPVDQSEMTPSQRRQWQALKNAAERHGQNIVSSPYRLG